MQSQSDRLTHRTDILRLLPARAARATHPHTIVATFLGECRGEPGGGHRGGKGSSVSALVSAFRALVPGQLGTQGEREGRSRADAVGPSLARSGKGRQGLLEALLTSSQQLCDNDPQWLIKSMK